VTRRLGFTIPEVLVASLLLLVVFGLTMQLWLNTSRGVGKGEDALASIQDASLVLLYLRKDLQRLVIPGDGGNWDLRYVHIRGQELTQNSLFWDEATQGLRNELQATNDSTDVFKEDKTELAFHVLEEDGSATKVTYTYLPEQRAMRRVEGFGARPKMFALPRLEDFRVQLSYASPGLSARDLLGSEREGTGRLLQFWFRLRFVVRGEEREGAVQTTRVDVDTNVFPRYANRRLHARWREGA